MKSFEFRWTNSLTCAFLLFVLLTGCSDDDPTDPGESEAPHVTTVVITPESATLGAVGDNIQFDADAFDQNGFPIESDYSWQSNDEDVVVIAQYGEAVATGFGTTEIYAAAEGVVDTASVARCMNGCPPRTATGMIRPTGVVTRSRVRVT